MRRIAVVVVTYDSAADVADCLGSLSRAVRGRPGVHAIVVDNASRDDTVRRIRDEHGWVDLVVNDRNRGFAGGCNVGIERALELGCDLVYLLNPDTEVAPDFLDRVLDTADRYPDAGAVQSLLCLHDEPERVNTAGNEIHFLGFGFCGRYRERRGAIGAEERAIPFASGACVLYRATALRDVGAFDEDLFLYQEDMDLGWRLRLGGWQSVLSPASIVLHKYRFSRGGTKMFFLERNRLIVLAKYLRIRSLAVLAPALVAADLAIFAMALRDGWFRHKLRADAHLLRPTCWRHIRRERERARRIRRVRDRDVARVFTSAMTFEDVRSPVMDRVANPAMDVAWRFLRRLLA